jgi:hypothetical protein
MGEGFVHVQDAFSYKERVGPFERRDQPRFMKAQHFPAQGQDERYGVIGGIVSLVESGLQKSVETDTARFHVVH